MSSRRGLAALILATSLPLAGCHLFGSGKEDIDRWGGLMSELRYQWISEPSIDLLSGPAVPVRAYIESVWLAVSAGNLDYAYLGFTRAVPDNAPADSPDIGARYRRPRVDLQLRTPLVGNEYYRILSLNRGGRNVTATLCKYTYAVANQQEDGRYVSAARGLREPLGIFAERVTLVAPADESTLRPQDGPAPAPSTDVFGDWQITGYLHALSAKGPEFDAQWPTFEADTAACDKAAPDSPEKRAFLTSGVHPRTDFPTTPASPGWPAE